MGFNLKENKMSSDKADQALIPTGYLTSAGLTTTPVWLDSVITWMEFGAVTIGLVVGITTIYFNILRIKSLKKKDEEE